MQPNNNSQGGNNTALVTILFVAVAGIGGYLLYTAGKKTAANAAGGDINPATGLPYSQTYGTTRPPTNYGSGTNTSGNTQGTVGAVGGLLNNIIGLFGKKKTTSGGNVNTQGHTLGGGLSGGGTSGGNDAGMWDSDFWGWADEYNNDDGHDLDGWDWISNTDSDEQANAEQPHGWD